MKSFATLAFAAGACAFHPTVGPMARASRPQISMVDDIMTPEKLTAAFERFDSDGSGQVDLEEFIEKMKGLDLPFNNMELEQMFSQIDDSSNGLIDAEEFQEYVVSNAHVGVVRRLSAQPDKVRELYESFKGSAEVLELEAFTAGMQSLGLPYNKMELEAMFGEIDETNNGGVDFEEFQEFLTQTEVPKWAQALAK